MVGFSAGPFILISRPEVIENIFHVLARLNPQKAFAIFSATKSLPYYHNPNNWYSSKTALEIAKEMSEKSKPHDKSFVKALNSFLDAQNPGLFFLRS